MLLGLLDAREVGDEGFAERGCERGIRLQRVQRLAQAGGQQRACASIGRIGRSRRRQLALDAV